MSCMMNKSLNISLRWQKLILKKVKSLKNLCFHPFVTKRTVTSTPNHGLENIILMGSPGSGKTTVGRILGKSLGMPVIDVDDHLLEPYWGVSVAKKLSEVGSERFVEEEGKALLHFERQGHVVSLTGSNPMYPAAMDYISKTGIVVFLDVKNEDITERLEKMKVNRILGQETGNSMLDILKYRQQFYEKAYDIRVVCEEKESQESITSKIVRQIHHHRNAHGYVSTRHIAEKTQEINFSEAILKGLAPDGGLFVTNCSIPTFSKKQWDRLIPLSYQDRSLRILESWIHPKDLNPQLLGQFVNRAYSPDHFDNDDIFPVRLLEDNKYLLELFHGPTSSFKDAALQLMPQFFLHALQYRNDSSKYIILVATSGDTGGAVLDGFSRYASDSGVGVFVLFPDDGISEVQKKQMTSIGSNNVHVVGVNGDFDDCQSFVKRAFQDKNLANTLLNENNIKLSAANSISWGRLVPQIVFHASAYLDLVKNRTISQGDEIDLCIPTGNFGNILAAYYAKEMGIPIKRFICASNENNVLTEFLNSGRYDLQNRQLIRTSSPAIDILVSSNLERYLYHVSNRNSSLVRSCFRSLETNRYFEVPSEILDTIKRDFTADWCTEHDCQTTIKETLKRTGYLLDPHTAVAKTVGDRVKQEGRPMVISSTAHCDKFAPEIMSFLDRSKHKDDLTSMFKMLQNLRSQPLPHLLLEESMDYKRIHNTVVNAEYKNVVEQILTFSRNV